MSPHQKNSQGCLLHIQQQRGDVEFGGLVSDIAVIRQLSFENILIPGDDLIANRNLVRLFLS